MRRPRRLVLDASVTGSDVARAVAGAGLVCFPTDTVYGVGGRVAPAVREALVAAKGRDEGKPLQVVYPTLELLEREVPMAPRLRTAVRRLLPGPLTLLLPYPAGLRFPPPGEVAGRTTLGLRVPAWPPRAAALAGLTFPLLASSANPSGGAAPAALEEVDPVLLAACDLALDAGRVGGRASTVVDLSAFADDGTWRVLRAGAVGEDAVASLITPSGERLP